jgi:SNF2 family DNA or RNA helicase
MHPSAELVILNFGKYSGYSLAHIANINESYLQWIANNDGMPAIWRTAARETLAGNDISQLDLPRRKAPATSASSFTLKTNIVKIYFVSKKTAAIEMPFNREKMNQFKYEIDGRTWNDEEKRWEFPIPHLPKVFEIFSDSDIRCEQNVIDVKDSLIAHREALDVIREKEDTDFDAGDLLLPLYPYQKVGVEFIHKAAGRALIADEPGLGKTVQAIAYARLHKLKTIIVCPLSVVITWRREIAKFTGLTPCVWTTDGREGRTNAQFHIINYDAVRKVADELVKQKYDLLICDEATYLKNRNTLRAKHILGNWQQRKKFPGIQTKYVIFLTGTPVMSRPIEAFALLSFIDKQRFNNFFHFVQRYGGWRGEAAKNLLDLHDRTKDLVIRRKKEVVYPELPKKQRNDLYVELTKDERQKYNELLQEMFGKWRHDRRPSIQHMPKIQGWLIQRKLPRLIQMVDEFMDNDKSILIFCNYLEPLRQLKEHYGNKAVVFMGDMNVKERQVALDALISKKAQVGCFSLKAGGMGIDGLQHAIDTVVFLDCDWVPANHEQAEDRTHRIGQTNKVQAYYMICEDTIDEHMRDILKEKQEIADLIVDGQLLTPEKKKSFFKEFVRRISRQYNTFFGDENE